MTAVRVIHWEPEESAPLLEACRSTGFEVDYLAGDGSAVCRAIRNKLPDVIVIDLTYRPSHGREVATWLRKIKAPRAIPIVFAGGEESKVAAVRERLPDAGYCEVRKIAAALKRAAKSAPKRDPIVPPGIMDRYREKSASEKLGLATGSAVAVVDPPREFPALLGALPESVEFIEERAPTTLWFVHDRESLLDSLTQMRAAAARTKLWLLWRKGSSGAGLTQNVLRETTREVGLVDYKICAVDARWSAMLFARKKT